MNRIFRLVPCLLILCSTDSLRAQTTQPSLPDSTKLDLFLLVGQSNMAGRGKVEPADQIINPRIWVLNQEQKWSPAVDPLHSADKPAALDHQLLAISRELAESLQLQASYVHAYAPLPRTMVFDAELVADYDSYCRKYGEQHRQAFDRLLAGYPGAEGQGHLVEGFAEPFDLPYVTHIWWCRTPS